MATQTLAIETTVKTVTAKEFFQLMEGNVPFTITLGGEKYNCVKLFPKGENFQADFKKGETRKGKDYAVVTPGSKVSYLEHAPKPKAKNKPQTILPEKVAPETKDKEIETIKTEVKAQPIAQPTEIKAEVQTIPDSIVNTQMIDWLEAQGDVGLLAKLCRLQAEFLSKMSQQIDNAPTKQIDSPAASLEYAEKGIYKPIANSASLPSPAPKKVEAKPVQVTSKIENTNKAKVDRDRFLSLVSAINFIDLKKGDNLDAKAKYYWSNKGGDIEIGKSQWNQYLTAMRWTIEMMVKVNGDRPDSENLVNFLADNFTFAQWVNISVKEKACPTGTPEEKTQHAIAVAKKYFTFQ